MVFGEILEPSSRALWEDDLEFSETFDETLTWNDPKVPLVINNIFICDTLRIVAVFNKCVIGDANAINQLSLGNTKIYRLLNDDYVVTCNGTDVLPGLITEKLAQWLKVARSIFVITSNLTTLLQNTAEKSPCVIRALSYKTINAYPQLESPNMIAGLSASIFSFCIHCNLPSTLYICYFDEVPLDSLNTQILLNLLRKLSLKVLKHYEYEPTFLYNNLYV
ncbi:hypothetical protein FQA39_LY14867 [Lamprigera yunnana]|nr:hypothetical protein FQA39_LY14867 [Lamprigera yunnana]